MTIQQDLLNLNNPEKIPIYKNFFKTGPGQYGEGDVFLGLSTPQQRTIAKKYCDLPLNNLIPLLQSDIHEFRSTALHILVDKFKGQREIYNFYMKNLQYVNNWDLVDISAHTIVGQYLLDKKRKPLYILARSENLWHRRIAIVATLQFIRANQYHDTVQIAHILVHDKHDLIHKAVGWMLREMGKKDQQVLEQFLDEHTTMPRTMLRSAIERFPLQNRKEYMNR